MSNSEEHVLLLVLGALLIAIPIVKAGFDRLNVPSLVGFIGLGLVCRIIDHFFPFISLHLDLTITFLADIGIVILLFQVGLKSDIRGLIKKLPYASLVWLGDVLASFLLAYLAARYLLQLSLLPSLVVATALTATSLAVSLVVWQEKGRVNSARGQLLIDVAELDDLSGVLLLAVLLAIIPVVQLNPTDLIAVLGSTVGSIVLTLGIFIGFCYWFANSFEAGFTRFNLDWTHSRRGLTIAVLGVALAIAAVAGYFGFSLAIGAMMAGLAFSRDKEAVHTNTRIRLLHDFFVPFFFVNIGLQVDPGSIAESIWLSIPLLLAAIAGKLVGVGIPILFRSGIRDALLLGVSMVPRAEISMMIVFQAALLDPELVPPALYSAMVIVVILSSVISPIVLRRLWD